MTKYTLLVDNKLNRHHHINGVSPFKNGPFVLFVIGVTIGVSFAIMYTQYQMIANNRSYAVHLDRLSDHLNGMDDQLMHGVQVIGSENATKNSVAARATSNNNNNDDEDVHAIENRTLATVLFQEVRVLCWILTTPNQHRTRAIHVKRTWGKRCNRILFMSSRHDKSIDSIALNVSSDSVGNTWAKTKRAFQYIYQHHRNDADWFLKADDDTYVVLENLRNFLYAYSTNDPVYFGYKMNRPDAVRHGYNAGGAGYVLSREALRRFGEASHMGSPSIITNDSLSNCHLDSDRGVEDIEMGKCMEALGVVAGDTRDEMKRGRFFLNTPEWHLIPGKIDLSNWYWKNMWYPANEGLHCCSDNAISFHRLRPEQMYSFDYLIYHLRPYGVVAFPQPLPKKVNFTELVAQMLDAKPTTATMIVSQSNLPN